MRPRSRTVALSILGASAFALAGCREEQVDAQAFPDLASCKAASQADGLIPAGACETAFSEAEQLHVEAAPRYDSIAVCEEQHGQGACGSERQVSEGGSGSIFMPLMAGYLVGSMLSGRSGMVGAQPLYRTSDGRYTNAGGTAAYSSNSGKAKLRSSLFQRPTSTIGKAPMTKATLSSRGGFGSTGSSRGMFGG
ncbi:DUF1190 domain-containing protein [Pseudooceanicola sediminis]|uniref:DUF1190 domain-containing protein n=1 Tax=Pseudooceanicola sediminis TaxID=2211117 RepID=A0A399J425_9RHOB|nr:DUF1190 domain-containing protein [Pseudooceanicola sediminis]KAA2316269.1 DUF1190 domain-containing protein [Puniceibacterium sp. HSS470]RII39179.1 DUF1190 domain-containing protein [Pseudooceanicola sediminis]|tara:strand:+ start:63174 stop:63755 length:582 start_codon:yes stop_codon:yes gene_type:complete